jgi:hypothetical protein
MKYKLDGELVFTLFLMAFVIVVLLATFAFPPLLRYTPFISGGLTAFFLAILIAGRIRPRILEWTETALQDMWGGGAGQQQPGSDADAPAPWPAVIRVMAYAFGYLIGVYFLGFFLVTPIFIALFLILDAKARPLIAIALAIGLCATLLILLRNLNVDLWTGVAPEIIPDLIGGAIVPQI